ncbi:hypothetical protein AB0A70_27045, partial [Streptomyces morookaense]
MGADEVDEETFLLVPAQSGQAPGERPGTGLLRGGVLGQAGTPAAAHVLGAQANLWTEVTETQQRVDYQA